MDKVDNKVTSFESLGLTKTKPKHTNEQPRLGQEDFVKLMTTQMNHQDPFKPMEDGQFLSQMAQFSAVSGLKDIKDSFLSLSESLKSSQALQASSMVGREVLVPGSNLQLTQAGIKGSVDLPVSTSNLKVTVQNKVGEVVHTIDLGDKQAGLVKFNWDGKREIPAKGDMPATTEQVPFGEYTVKAEYEVDGELQAVNTMVTDKVESVSLGQQGQGITLNLANSGATAMSKVKEIM